MSLVLDQLDPERLLEHVDRLLKSTARDARGRPYALDLRRAVSASYYALFHAISAETVRHVFGGSPVAVEHAVRWINHGDVRRASSHVITYNAQPNAGTSWKAEKTAIWALFAADPPGSDLVDVCAQFVLLMDLRHVADYGRDRSISKSEARQAAHDARLAVDSLKQLVARGDPATRTYLGLVAFAAGRLPG